ncbi:MAG: 30S ribosome-binding factor RbfA [Tannerella sp.]|jgi:ribosome-binding factor A|nr:30S ribosome-binding factor RbfA [Tannerella sp.]
MEVKRIDRIGRLLQKELGDLFRLQTRAMHGTLISVTSVRVSPDLGVAKVYLSIFPPERKAELMEAVEASRRTVRYDLGQRVRMQLRKIPELVFYLDDSLDYVENIDRLLNS